MDCLNLSETKQNENNRNMKKTLNLGMMIHVYHCRTQEVETAGSEAWTTCGNLTLKHTKASIRKHTFKNVSPNILLRLIQTDK